MYVLTFRQARTHVSSILFRHKVANTAPANGIFPNVFDQKPTEGSQMPGLLSQATGFLPHSSDLLSGGALDWATPNPPIVWNASFKQLIFAILLRLLSFLRGFIPPVALNLFVCLNCYTLFHNLTFCTRSFSYLPLSPFMSSLFGKFSHNCPQY